MGWQFGPRHFIDQRLAGKPMRDDVPNGQDWQLMLPGKYLEIGSPRHLPVVPHNLANYAGGREPSQPHQVNGALSMTIARQHAIFGRPQWKDVTGGGNSCGRDIRVGRDQHRSGPVMGRYSRRDPLGGLNGDRSGSSGHKGVNREAPAIRRAR